MRGYGKTLGMATIAVLLLTGCLSPTGRYGPADAAAAPGPLALEAIPLATHVHAGVFEQDVYVDRGDGLGVYRATVADAADPALAGAPLYATTAAQKHDFTFSNGGPFAKGPALGFSLAQWLAARGSIAYACRDGTAAFASSFAGLVPNGVYTIWYARMELQDGGITGGKAYPLGAADGSANAFTAGPDGTAEHELATLPCVEPTNLDSSGTGTSTLFAIAYHSDGLTYGDVPGDFGRVTHVQLFAMAKAATGG